MPFDVEVNIKEYRGLDVLRIASEEIQAAAIDGMNQWKANLDAGQGATGTHGQHRTNGPKQSAYRHEGEAIGDVTVNPQTPGELEYRTGGDVVQLAVAEFGRAPGSPPPYEAIARWAELKGLVPEEGQTFEDMVTGIRFAIAERGLPGFGPGQKAAHDSAQDLDKRVVARINAELEKKG